MDIYFINLYTSTASGYSGHHRVYFRTLDEAHTECVRLLNDMREQFIIAAKDAQQDFELVYRFDNPRPFLEDDYGTHLLVDENGDAYIYLDICTLKCPSPSVIH